MKTQLITRYLLVALTFLLTMNVRIANAQWNTNTSVNLEISGLELADMETASTTDGKLWVAFYQPNGTGNYDMRAQLFDAAGHKLLGANGVLVSSKPTGTATFVFNACVAADNNFVIACQDERSGVTLQSVLYKVSQTGTPMWGADGLVLGDGLAPNVALLSNGEIITAFNEGNTNTLMLQKVTTDGLLAWATPIPVYVGTAKTTMGQMVPNSNGKFTMIYQKRGTAIYTTLYAQQFDNSGIKVYDPLQLSNETTHSTRYYSLAFEGDTAYVGYYSASGSRFNSWFQRINPDGTIPWGINGSHFNTSVGSSDNYQMQTNINLAPGSPYVWALSSFTTSTQSPYGVFVQKFLKTTGARLFTDQAKVVYPVSTMRDQQIGNLLLMNDTPMFTTYDKDDKIYATKLDASGDFSWSYNRAEVSSTIAPAGIPKMRHNFNTVGNTRCANVWTEKRGSIYLGYIQGISNNGLFGLKVATLGNVPANISVVSGTLQLTDTVYPSYANQAVIWSMVQGTGQASINSSGLVTAITNGTVYAKAIAVQDNTVHDSLLITISNQVVLPPAVVTLAATNTGLYSTTLNGTVNANYAASTASFQWGTSVSYGSTASATPSAVSGSTPVPVLASLSGLTAGTTYHYRCVANNVNGSTNGNDMTFTTACLLAGTMGSVTGTSTVCVNATGIVYTVPAFTGATAYVWALPAGAIITAGINTNSITVSFSASAQSGNISVYATGGGCMSIPSPPFNLTVNGVPTAPGAINGVQIVCEGETGVSYSVTSMPGVTTYTWTLPTGVVIATGSGTSSITVNYPMGSASGNVTVSCSNSCGSGPASNPLPVVVAPLPGTPGTITGLANICTPMTGVSYSVAEVPNGYGYEWTLPAGATIASGSGTNQITVNYNPTAVSGIISVRGTNGNCPGPTSVPLPVITNPTPGAPVITFNNFVLSSSASSGNQWYKNGVIIPGAGSPAYTVTQNGTYTVVVTVNGCSSAVSNSINVTSVAVKELQPINFEIFPNPSNGVFELKANNPKNETYTVEVYNSIGKSILKQENVIFGSQSITVDMANMPVGNYIVVLRCKNESISRKMTIIR